METLANLLIQVVAGAVGGNAAGATLKDFDLNKLGNTIAGAVGGGVAGQILQALLPALMGAAGGSLDVGSIISQAVGGGAGGVILTVIAGLVRNAMSGAKAT